MDLVSFSVEHSTLHPSDSARFALLDMSPDIFAFDYKAQVPTLTGDVDVEGRDLEPGIHYCGGPY